MWELIVFLGLCGFVSTAAVLIADVIDRSHP